MYLLFGESNHYGSYVTLCTEQVCIDALENEDFVVYCFFVPDDITTVRLRNLQDYNNLIINSYVPLINTDTSSTGDEIVIDIATLKEDETIYY